MVARHIEQFTVTTSEDLSDLEACLSDRRVESALIDIPESSATMLTAREFRRVVALARERGIDITFSTDDPLRRELARIVGGRLSGDPVLRSALTLAPVTSPDDATRRIDDGARDDDASSSDGSVPPQGFKPWQTPVSTIGAGELDIEYDQSNPSFSFVVNPPVQGRTSGTAPLAPPARDPLHDVWDGYAPPQPVFHRSQRTAPKKRRKLGTTIAVLMTAAAVLVSGLLVAIVVLPAATIQLTPATQQISAVVTYGVAHGGQELDIVIQPQPISTVLAFESIIPATGSRTEPDGTATGSILLTNTSTVDIVVPAGTVFTSAADISVATTEDAVVPAADPFGTLTVGSTTIQASATVPGPEGNIAPESIQGQLESGVFYSNREAFSGGTVREITVVSAGDIAALRQQAENDLNSQAGNALESRLLPDQHILDGTKQREAISYTFDHEAGADAHAVRVQATLALSASTYRLGDVHEHARAEVSRLLSGSAAAGTALLSDTVSIGEPLPLDGANGLAFSVSATATTRSIIDSATIADLESDLVGMSPDQAMARIQQVQGVETVDIRYERDWFGERMPRLQSRISIEVLDAAGVSTQATSPGP